MIRPTPLPCVLLLAVAGCSEQAGDSPFSPGGNSGGSGGTGAPPDDGTTGDPGTTTEDPQAEDEGGGDGGTTGTSAASTGGDDAPGETGDDAAFLVPMDMGAPEGQPEGGQYSHCTVPQDCPGLAGCMRDGDDPNDGFCSVICTDGSECDPSPGGTSTAACVEVVDGAGTVKICALDCSGGGECPQGMLCKPQSDLVSGADEICV